MTVLDAIARQLSVRTRNGGNQSEKFESAVVPGSGMHREKRRWASFDCTAALCPEFLRQGCKHKGGPRAGCAAYIGDLNAFSINV